MSSQENSVQESSSGKSSPLSESTLAFIKKCEHAAIKCGVIFGDYVRKYYILKEQYSGVIEFDISITDAYITDAYGQVKVKDLMSSINKDAPISYSCFMGKPESDPAYTYHLYIDNDEVVVLRLHVNEPLAKCFDVDHVLINNDCTVKSFFGYNLTKIVNKISAKEAICSSLISLDRLSLDLPEGRYLREKFHKMVVDGWTLKHPKHDISKFLINGTIVKQSQLSLIQDLSIPWKICYPVTKAQKYESSYKTDLINKMIKSAGINSNAYGKFVRQFLMDGKIYDFPVDINISFRSKNELKALLDNKDFVLKEVADSQHLNMKLHNAATCIRVFELIDDDEVIARIKVADLTGISFKARALVVNDFDVNMVGTDTELTVLEYDASPIFGDDASPILDKIKVSPVEAIKNRIATITPDYLILIQGSGEEAENARAATLELIREGYTIRTIEKDITHFQIAGKNYTQFELGISNFDLTQSWKIIYPMVEPPMGEISIHKECERSYIPQAPIAINESTQTVTIAGQKYQMVIKTSLVPIF